MFKYIEFGVSNRNLLHLFGSSIFAPRHSFSADLLREFFVVEDHVAEGGGGLRDLDEMPARIPMIATGTIIAT